MFIERLQEQIRRAEKRYQDHEEQRINRGKQLDLIDSGELGQVDMSALDNPGRIQKRFSLFEFANDLLGAAIPSVSQPEVILERIIKSNELMSSAFLIEGERHRRTIGRVVIRSSTGRVLGFGTGSMISPRLMMTNNHVLQNTQEAANSTIQFDFLQMSNGDELPTIEFSLDPSTFFVTDEALDFSIIAVNELSEDGVSLKTRGWSPFIEESGKAVVGERVNIIQHPGGERQQIALRQNRIIDVVGDFLHYQTDTQQGSSGSPVSNDNWQTAALHHAGVPERNSNGQILLTNGKVWDGSQSTIPQISWIANEGTRISRITKHIKDLESSFSDQQSKLFAQAFELPTLEQSDSLPQQLSGGGGMDSGGRIVIDGDGGDPNRLTYTVPIQISVGFPQGNNIKIDAGLGKGQHSQAVSSKDTRKRTPVAMSHKSDINENDLALAQQAIQRFESVPYYDEAADNNDISEYYDGIAEDSELVGKPLFNKLSELVKSTHKVVLSYKKARLEHLYPWIDLRPDRKLKSIYSGTGFDPEEAVRLDLTVEARRERAIERFTRSELFNAEALELFLDNLESSSPFNCEHVVPQSWFGKTQPMKADLHHLFTCESGCNSFRSNIPYFQFPPTDEVIREKCGRRETDERKFEPSAGKGVVARATLYFLIRYIGVIGDEGRELQKDRLGILLKWHEEEPVTEYERHRNAAIRAVQGNRNPLIDFPEWAEHISFEGGFG